MEPTAPSAAVASARRKLAAGIITEKEYHQIVGADGTFQVRSDKSR
jgi:hypothetical protein